MLNLILAVLVPFLITTAEEQTVSNIEVVEIFRAETAEELEASLTDGYPMPWLEEILNDESIPEEDRYWLDCRVRAEIAQDLNLFFNEEGDLVFYEADRIRSGEDYWRECFIVNPPGVDEQVADPPEGQTSGIGILVDHFGNEIGEIAISNSNSMLSRDGSVGVTQSGIQDMRSFGPGLMNLCFFYPDGSFIEFPIHHYRLNETVSQSGNLVVASCIDRGRNDQKIHKLYEFDSDMNLLFEKILELRPNNGSSSIAISPNDGYIALATLDLQVGSYPVILFDVETGEERHTWDLTIGNNLNFSPDSRFLCIAGGGAGAVVDCESGEVVWSRFLDKADYDPEIEQVRNLYCTNNAEIIYWLATRISPTACWPMLSEHDNQIVIANQIYGRPAISPNGYIYVAQRYLTVASSTVQETPFRVAILNGGE